MITIEELERYCNHILDIDAIRDYCPNGLQVARRAGADSAVTRIVTGVTASQALIDQAAQREADLLLVHHGYFWRGEAPELTGMKYRRVRSLMEHDIGLMAYHLPLDVHREFGNNAQLANRLGIHNTVSTAVDGIDDLFWQGELCDPCLPDTWVEHIGSCLSRTPLAIIPDARSTVPVRRVGWCTGGAQRYIEQAIDAGLDAFVSGEVSEQTTHLARENDIIYVAAGHHATERYGVLALGQHLAEKFGIECDFIDCENPV